MPLTPRRRLGLVSFFALGTVTLPGTLTGWTQEPLVLRKTRSTASDRDGTSAAPAKTEPVASEGKELRTAQRIAAHSSPLAAPWLRWAIDAWAASDSDGAVGSDLEIAADAAVGDDGEVGEYEVLDADEPSGPIIEISDATRDAIAEEDAVAELTMEIPTPSSRTLSPRNLRTPRPLDKLVLDAPDSREDEAVSDDNASSEDDAVSLDTSSPLTIGEPAKPASVPPPLSDSMKSVRNGPPPKRSLNLKSADEDMKDYLAQEEPDASALAVTRDDSHQGIDAEKARKPERESDLATESGPVRTPIVVPENRSTSAPSVNPSQQRRLQRVDACLTYYLTNPETTTARSPWAVMHALLPFGADYELAGPSGRVNAIGWMCHNGLCRTQRIFTPRGNSFVPNVGGGVQGHQGQFLAILAQCQVPLNYPIQIGSRQYQVEDLVRYEMATCRERTELTFKLIGLSYYVDANKQWRSNDGKVWNLAKLLQEELAQPIVGSACGGTHRLMGYSFALKQRSLQGEPITGVYARAARVVEEYVQYTWRLQNPDGSFSTQWYEGRGNDPKDERKVQTSGHMLEWLMFTIPDSELVSPRVERAVDFLLQKIYDQRENKWPIGPRGHATRALALYTSRMANSTTNSSSSDEAGGSTRTAMRVPASPESRVPEARVPAPQGGASIQSPANSPPSAPRNSPSNRPTSRINRRFRG